MVLDWAWSLSVFCEALLSFFVWRRLVASAKAFPALKSFLGVLLAAPPAGWLIDSFCDCCVLFFTGLSEDSSIRKSPSVPAPRENAGLGGGVFAFVFRRHGGPQGRGVVKAMEQTTAAAKQK